MRISVIGSGYVGLITGLCLADLGNEVVCIDVIESKVETINRGQSPIFEEGIDELLIRCLASERFRATIDISTVAQTDITFICVGTPSNPDGTWNIDHVRSASKAVGKALGQKSSDHVVVLKSTVIPMTCETVVLPILEAASGRRQGHGLGVAVNPEFLREGTAISDFMNPDRVVIGSGDHLSSALLRELYAPLGRPIVEVPLATAEMIKVASNAFLATKISFVNEVGNICKDMGIDFRSVAEGMGPDPRIGPLFLNAGAGFGGSCFPKDVRGIAAEAHRRGLEPLILDAVLEVNDRQPLRMVEMLARSLDINGVQVAVLGLAFKPGTDDVRESRSIPVVTKLLERGAKVVAHDYQAIEGFRKLFPEITYYDCPEDCVAEADAVLIMTAWPGYSRPEMYDDKLVIDGRGVTRSKNYEGICW